jgi:hypothetical protein
MVFTQGYAETTEAVNTLIGTDRIDGGITGGRVQQPVTAGPLSHRVFWIHLCIPARFLLYVRGVMLLREEHQSW